MNNINRLPSGETMQPRKGFATIALLACYALYIEFASSLPMSVVMWQGFDDALFIRLGRHIANGQWLGPYTELTLFKGPIYSISLAVASSTGLPIDIAQYTFFFLCSVYASFVFSQICNGSPSVRFLILGACLLCPTNYILHRVTREFFYTGLALVTLSSLVHVLFLARQRSLVWLGSWAGFLLAVFWLTREEGLWIVPTCSVLFIGAILRPTWKDTVIRIRLLAPGLASLVVGIIATIGIIGALNTYYYGRFVIVEMKSSEFQRAMIALQRVGATYNKPFLPVPRAARDAIYMESPSFALLRPFLDPPNKKSPWEGACPLIEGTCGDLPGGWFMWALRDAAAKAGMHQSAKTAATYYETLAAEIELGCTQRRLDCIDWLPPFIPSINSSQWALLPSAIGRGLLLVIYVPPPSYKSPPSSLDTPDAGNAVEFLNRPYGVILTGKPGIQSGARTLIQSVWVYVLSVASQTYRLILPSGLVAALLSIMIFRRVVFQPIFIAVFGLTLAIGMRVLVLALVEISSFPTLFHERMAPTNPLAIIAAILSFYIFIQVVRSHVAGRSGDVVDGKK